MVKNVMHWSPSGGNLFVIHYHPTFVQLPSATNLNPIGVPVKPSAFMTSLYLGQEVRCVKIKRLADGHQWLVSPV